MNLSASRAADDAGAHDLRNRPVPSDVLDAAIVWQLRCGEGAAATPDDQQDLKSWLEAHPDHARAWRQLGEIDAQLGSVGGQAARSAVLRPRRRRAQTAGAVLGVALSVGMALCVLDRFQPVGQLMADYHTRTGERRTVVLPDQTVLHLNSRSAVDVEFGAELRAIRLRVGEIAVETSHANADEHRPLVVLTEDGSLRALGTRFVVRRVETDAAQAPESDAAPQSATELSVLQSAVAARPAACNALPAVPCAEERIVSAGQGLRLQPGGMDPLAIAPDADAWKDGVLVVENQPLAEVVAILARHRAGHLGVDPAVAGMLITGTLPLADTDQALLALTAALPVEVAYKTRWWLTLQPRSAPQ